MTTRLDVSLTERGLAPSRHRASEMIRAGLVQVDGQIVQKPAYLVLSGTKIDVKLGHTYVSRAGQKLEHALVHFDIDPRDLNVLDIGASTGGFTDCLLQRGAARVWAVDVGHGQLAESLRVNPRVTVMEGVNARELKPMQFESRADMAVIDVSFISQRLIWPALIGCLTEQAAIVSLVKPQFEAGRAAVGKGGIIRDHHIHQRVIDELMLFAERLGLIVHGLTDSPILGGDGNREFLLFLGRV